MHVCDLCRLVFLREKNVIIKTHGSLEDMKMRERVLVFGVRLFHSQLGFL